MFQNKKFSHLTEIPSALTLVSFIEILEQVEPKICITLLEYLSQLIQNHVITFGNKTDFESTLIFFNQLMINKKKSDSKELEIFAEKVFHKYNNNKSIPELLQLSYLCFTAISIFGTLNPFVIKRIEEIELILFSNNKNDIKDINNISSSPNSLILAEITKNSFKKENFDIAFSALEATIKELEKELLK